jgi:hypothetical protein
VTASNRSAHAADRVAVDRKVTSVCGPERIGEFWSYPAEPPLAELLIDCEEDRTLRAVLRRDAERGRPLGSVLGTPRPRLHCLALASARRRVKNGLARAVRHPRRVAAALGCASLGCGLSME